MKRILAIFGLAAITSGLAQAGEIRTWAGSALPAEVLLTNTWVDGANGIGDTLQADAYSYYPHGVIYDNVQEGWQQVAGLPAVLINFAAVTYSNAIYTLGGQDADMNAVTNVFRFDGTNWASVAGLPGSNKNQGADAYDGAVYSVGGNGISVYGMTNNYRYDGTSWAEVAGLPLGATNTGFFGQAVKTYGGYLYSMSGYFQCLGTYTNVFRYNGSIWEGVAGLPVSSMNAGAAVLGTNLYYMGGLLLSVHTNFVLTNMFRFDGAAWSPIAGLPAARCSMACMELGSAIYVAGGMSESFSSMTNMYRFSGTNWQEVMGLPHGIGPAAGVVLNGRMYVLGGYDASRAGGTDVHRYEPGSVGVAPVSGSVTGGYTVVIGGTNLCDGTMGDVTSVTLCGVAATVVSVAGSTQIVVTAGIAPAAGLGDIVVESTSHGTTGKSSAFTYLKQTQAITFPAIPEQIRRNAVVLSATASSGLPVSFVVADGPGVITAGVLRFMGTGQVQVVASQTGSAAYAAATPVTNSVSVTGGHVSGDYSGDGTTSLTVFDPASGTWYCLTRDGQMIMWGLGWGGPGLIPVAGDFDGDGVADQAAYDPATGKWYIRNMQGVVIAWGLDWGGPGLEPVAGDFDRDGATDLAVYDEANGLWYIRTLDGTVLAWARAWGCPGEGMHPVAGDYDGDAISDLCVYDEANGLWYALSGAMAGDTKAFTARAAGVIAWNVQWGGPGYEPMTGDYDGDQVFDLAVYGEAAGLWYVRTLAGVTLAWDLAWGGPGMTAVPGDYDGDGAWDVMVYQQADGTWYAWSIAQGEVLLFDTTWGGSTLEPVMR